MAGQEGALVAGPQRRQAGTVGVPRVGVLEVDDLRGTEPVQLGTVAVLVLIDQLCRARLAHRAYLMAGQYPDRRRHAQGVAVELPVAAAADFLVERGQLPQVEGIVLCVDLRK